MTTETASAASLALPLGDLTAPQALMLARNVAADLGWTVYHLSAAGLMVQGPGTEDAAPLRLTLLLYSNGVLLSSPDAAADAEPPAYLEAFGEAFLTALTTARGAELQEQYEQARPTFVSPAQDVLAPRQERRTAKDWLNLLRPQPGYLVTPLLIDTCLLVFVLMLFSGANIMSPSADILLRWGADYGPLTLGEGQWWRLLSNAFVHIGVLHLLLNMYALLNIGLLLEPRVGPLRFGLAYLLAALGGSLGSLWWHDYTVSAGASGAIFGLYGVFLALLTTNVVEAEARKPLLTSIGTFVVYNLMFGLTGSIDNAAHIGGLLTGLLVGYGYWAGLRPEVPARRQHLLTAGLAAVLLAGAVLAYHHLPNAWTEYQAVMQQVGRREERALDALRLPPDATRSQQLDALSKRGTDYWKLNLRLLQRLDSLRLPEEAKKRNEVFKRYTRLRLDSYRLMHRAVEENTNAYADSIRTYNQQIEAILETGKNQAE